MRTEPEDRYFVLCLPRGTVRDAKATLSAPIRALVADLGKKCGKQFFAIMRGRINIEAVRGTELGLNTGDSLPRPFKDAVTHEA